MRRQTRIITLLTLSIILLTILVSAENTITPITIQQTGLGQQLINPTEIQDFYIREEIKTRSEFKTYTDNKLAEWKTWFLTEGQAMIDANFAEMDRRVRLLAQDIFIKFVIGATAIILFANALWYLIKNKLDNMGKRPTFLTDDEYTGILAGIITQEYKDNITKQNETIQKSQKPIYRDEHQELKVPTPEEIDYMLSQKRNKKKIEEEIKKRQKIENEKIKLEKKIEKESKKRAEKIEKLRAETEKKQKEKEEEIQKIQQQIQKLSPSNPPSPPPALMTILPPNPPNTN